MSIKIDWSKFKDEGPVGQIILNNKKMITADIEYCISQHYSADKAASFTGNDLYASLVTATDEIASVVPDVYQLACYTFGTTFDEDFHTAIEELVKSCYPVDRSAFYSNLAKKPASRKPAPKKRSAANSRTGKKR